MRAWLAACLLLLWPLAGLAQQTEDGDRGFIQGLLEDALSDDRNVVRLEGFRGALRSRATVDRITISDPRGVWLSAEDVAMVWTRSALFQGRVEIDEISIASLSIPRQPDLPESPPSPEARSPFALPELPVALRLDDLEIARVTLGAPLLGEEVVLTVQGRAALESGAGEALLSVQRLDRGGTIDVEGSYDNASRQLALDLAVAEPEGGLAAGLLRVPGTPSIALTLAGDAPIDDFAAALTLATDGRPRLSGDIVLQADGEADTRRFRVDIGGDLAPVVAPQYRDFLGSDVTLAAEVVQDASGGVSLREMSLQAQALSLTGFARLAPDGWPEELDLDARIVPPRGTEVVLPLPGAETRIALATLGGRFDAADGNGWQLTGQVSGLVQEGAGRLDRLAFTGGGEIARSAARATGVVSLQAEGLAPADAALAAALGDAVRGTLGFDWRRGAPLRLTAMEIAGADYGLTGAVEIDGSTPLNPVLRPDVTLRADRLARFAPLAGIDLGGAAELSISGAVAPVTGGFDLRLAGGTRDLATGIARLDPLLAGEGRLALDALRDERGLVAQRLEIATAAASITGQGRLAQQGSTADLRVRLPDSGVLLPGLSGESQIVLSARQRPGAWDLDLTGTVPDAAWSASTAVSPPPRRSWRAG